MLTLCQCNMRIWFTLFDDEIRNPLDRFSQPLMFTACNHAFFSARGWDNPSNVSLCVHVISSMLVERLLNILCASRVYILWNIDRVCKETAKPRTLLWRRRWYTIVFTWTRSRIHIYMCLIWWVFAMSLEGETRVTWTNCLLAGSSWNSPARIMANVFIYSLIRGNIYI